jgi:plasmid stabilization system protein ParE
MVSRQAAIDALDGEIEITGRTNAEAVKGYVRLVRDRLERLPSAQPEQRYTEEELRVFQHGISLRLLSKRSSQHWQYDEDTATEIKFLERLYEKVGADIRSEHDG